jgi:hypothetical protein
MGSPGSWNTNTKAQSSATSKSVIKWILLGGGVVALLLMGTCGRTAYHSFKITNNAVERFHSQLDNSEYEDIYGDATDEFRAAGSREQQIAFLQTIHEKMGHSGKCSVTGFHINANTKGTFLNEVCATVFVAGSANEYFVWRIDGEPPKLWSYHIDSPGLR